jgi:hypothetical protein
MITRGERVRLILFGNPLSGHGAWHCPVVDRCTVSGDVAWWLIDYATACPGNGFALVNSYTGAGLIAARVPGLLSHMIYLLQRAEIPVIVPPGERAILGSHWRPGFYRGMCELSPPPMRNQRQSRSIVVLREVVHE